MEARDALRMWVRDGLLDADVAQQLGESLEYQEQPAKTRALIGLLVTVGSLLVGGGLLLFIASHWDEQSPTRRLLLLFAIYLVVVAAAAVASRQRLTMTAGGLWFLSSLAVGANLFLIGQVFNLPLNYWQAILLWMIVALVVGWAEPSEAQGWLVITLSLLTVGWMSVPDSEFFDQGAFLFDEAGLRSMLPLVGLALASASLSVVDTEFAFLKRPAMSIGVTLIAVPLTVSTFHPEAFEALFDLDFGWFHVVVIVVSLAAVGLTWWIRRPGPLLTYSVAGMAALMAVVLPQVDVSADERLRFGTESASWLADPFFDSAVLFGIYTAVIFAIALTTAAAGRWLAIPALVNTGVAVIGVMLASVYIGRLAGTMPTSIAVLIGGVLLIGGAVFLERTRRDLIGGLAS